MKETILGPRKRVLSLLVTSVLYALAVFLFAVAMARQSADTVGYFLLKKRPEFTLAIVVFVFQLVALLGGQTLVGQMEKTKYRIMLLAFETPLFALLLYALLPSPWWLITFAGLLLILSMYEFILAKRRRVGRALHPLI